MIFDSMKRFSSYARLAPGVWGKVEKFIAESSASTPVGRYVIDGDLAYASVQSYNTHEFNPEKLENHRDFVDIQLLLDGEETIWWRDVEGLEEAKPYKPDIAFFRAGSEGAVPLLLKPGYFALFLPEEGHQPGVGDPSRKAIKLVIKLHRSLFEG